MLSMEGKAIGMLMQSHVLHAVSEIWLLVRPEVI